MKIDLEDLKDLVRETSTSKWKYIEKNLVSSDPEDGVADYDLIIQNKIDDKYYLIQYCYWDIENDDLVRYTYDDLTEVFPKDIIKTIYVK